MANKPDALEKLEELTREEYRVVALINSEIEALESPQLSRQYARFVTAHERHAEALGRIISAVGGDVPEEEAGEPGFLTRLFSRPAARKSAGASLKKVLENEREIQNSYKKALHSFENERVNAILLQNMEDHSEQIRSINANLKRVPGDLEFIELGSLEEDKEKSGRGGMVVSGVLLSIPLAAAGALFYFLKRRSDAKKELIIP